MILAAAIKCYVTKTNSEVILCGARHGDCFAQLNTLGFSPHIDYLDIEEGFIDNHNNFLTRQEAFNHAKEIGQLSSKIVYEREHGEIGNNKLISEDLW